MQMVATVAITTSPMQAVIHIPRLAILLLNMTSGSRRNGNKMPAVAAPVTVSVKMTVTR
jgi:hypothetical protein